MSKKYLFIGGPKDGERLCTNGVPEVRIPMTYSDENSSPVPGSSFHECRYALHESFAPGGRKIAFYALNGLHLIDAVKMMMDNYQPKPVVSGEEVDWNKKIDWAKEPERMHDIAETGYDDLDAYISEKIRKNMATSEIKNRDKYVHGNGVKPPETGVFMVEIQKSWLCGFYSFAEHVLDLKKFVVLVFDSMSDVNRVHELRDNLNHSPATYCPDGSFFIFGHRWCIKGQEDKIYPEGE